MDEWTRCAIDVAIQYWEETLSSRYIGIQERNAHQGAPQLPTMVEPPSEVWNIFALLR